MHLPTTPNQRRLVITRPDDYDGERITIPTYNSQPKTPSRSHEEKQVRTALRKTYNSQPKTSS